MYIKLLKKQLKFLNKCMNLSINFKILILIKNK